MHQLGNKLCIKHPNNVSKLTVELCGCVFGGRGGGGAGGGGGASPTFEWHLSDTFHDLDSHLVLCAGPVNRSFARTEIYTSQKFLHFFDFLQTHKQSYSSFYIPK